MPLSTFQNDLLAKHCHTFEEDEHSDEYKIEHMLLFEDYFQTLESFITKELNEKLEDFEMKDFLTGNSIVSLRKILVRIHYQYQNA